MIIFLIKNDSYLLFLFIHKRLQRNFYEVKNNILKVF